MFAAPYSYTGSGLFSTPPTPHSNAQGVTGSSSTLSNPVLLASNLNEEVNYT